METERLQRFTAFSDDPDGGNPAGVWVGEALPSDEVMLGVAAEVGYSETAFVAPAGGDELEIRYFSPEREIPFCGHATIALGARLRVEVGSGRYILHTQAGTVPLDVEERSGVAYATLTSVEPTSQDAPDSLVEGALASMGWSRDDLSSAMEPAVADAGARHLLLPVVSRERLAQIEYDFDGLRDIMLANDLATVDLFWSDSWKVIHSRNLFPVGGVVEDPATGAAAAALGGHLRATGTIVAPADLVIHQGVDMGQASLLQVRVPVAGGIEVSGAAVMIDPSNA